MNLDVFARFVLAVYADQARKEEPNIGPEALLRRCVELACEEIKSELFVENAFEEAPNIVSRIVAVKDYDYWCQLASWTPEEAAFLALGFDPRGAALIHFADARIYQRFEDWRRVAERYRDAGEDCAPAALCRHMKRFNVNFPNEIIAHLKKNERYLMRYQRRYEKLKNTSKRMALHRDSYLKLIYALIVERMGYSEGGHTNVVSKVREELEKLDMSLTEKPIRNILNLAVDRYKFLKKK